MKFKLKKTASSYAQDDRGVSTVESVIIMGIFTTILMWTIEVGILMFRWVNFERAVNEVARDIRVYGLAEKFTNEAHPDYEAGAAHSYLKGAICDASVNLTDCENSVLLELSSIDLTAGVPTLPVACRDRTDDAFDPATAPSIDPGDRGEPNGTSVTYLRACLIIDTLLAPNASLPFNRDPSGGVAIRVDQAFINEPQDFTTPGLGG